MAKILGPTANVGLGFWAQSTIVLDITAPVLTPIFDLPPSGPVYPISTNAWIWTALPLFAEAPTPVGKVETTLPTSQPISSFGFIPPYNLSLLSVPLPPVDTTNIPARILDWGTPPEAEYHVSMRSWAGVKTPAAALFTKPFLQSDWPLTPAPKQPERTVTASYNPNLVGQDRLPVGEVIYDLTPRPHEYRVQIHASWTWNYNLNLIGKDLLPVGEAIFALPVPQDYPVQLRQWLSAKPPTPPEPLPFNQRDWPIPTQPRQFDLRTWSQSPAVPPLPVDTTSIPARVLDWGTPPAAGRLQATWTSALSLTLTTPVAPKPAAQYDWPLTPLAGQPAKSWSWSYNLNLIGKDQLPVGDISTALAPTGHIYPVDLRSWIVRVNLALVVTPVVLPYNQYDWPNPRLPQQPTPVWTRSYNLNLIGKDQLPAGEVVSDLPPQRRVAAQTWINAVNLALTSVQVVPFNQLDWQRPIAAAPVNRSFAAFFNPNLIGKDRLPFRQQDWPIYRPFLQPAFGYTASYNRNLIGKDRLPFRQQHWPLTPDHRRLSDWILDTDPNLYIPPPPPPAPRDPTHARTRGGFELNARGASLDHRGAGIDQRGTSPDRRGGGRSSRGRNQG
jgi:hypothetical protein